MSAANYGKKVAVLDFVHPSTQGNQLNYSIIIDCYLLAKLMLMYHILNKVLYGVLVEHVSMWAAYQRKLCIKQLCWENY